MRWSSLVDHLGPLGPPQALVAEVTYVNDVEHQGGLPTISPAFATFPGSDRVVQEHAQLTLAVPGGGGHSTITFAPGGGPGSTNVTDSTRVTVPGASGVTDTDGVVAAMRRAHAASVVSFTDITRAEMHETWERER